MIVGQDKIIHNWLMDFKKKEVSNFERAKVINEYLTEKKLSQRELAKQLDMSHSTLQDWMIWNNLTEKEYNKLIKKGLTETDIYRLLRDGKKEEKKKLMGITKLDSDLNTCIKKLRPHINTTKESSAKTTVLIEELKKVLGDLLAAMEYAELGKKK